MLRKWTPARLRGEFSLGDAVELVELLLIGVPALLLGLPAICDLWAWLRADPRSWRDSADGAATSAPPEASPPLLFLVPAHDEEDLIGRCVESLRTQDYPADRLTVMVIADHCRDRTATVAREAGANVLVRRNERQRGKHHAIDWALEQLPLDDWSAMVVIDADTIVDTGYARHLARRAPLRRALIQTYVGMSNEFENWLTRMAGLLTRNRWGVALPLKDGADLNCPLTGDGSVFGTEILMEYGWDVETITEGWELYSRYTLEGLMVDYEDRARLYAQETRSVEQSETQRQRWTAGRMAVLRRYWWRILKSRELPLLQRLDLIAELSSTGPVMHGFLGFSGLIVTLLLNPPLTPLLIALFATTVIQPVLYSLISLAKHPEPVATLGASLRLPLYAAWRIPVGVKAFLMSGTERWIRTGRHEEPTRELGPAPDAASTADTELVP